MSDPEPCFYIVQNGDTFSAISEKVCGNITDTWFIEDQNRNLDGTYKSLLHPGNSIYVNCKDTDIPATQFPDCIEDETLPCLYQVKDFDTLETISASLLGRAEYKSCIIWVNRQLWDSSDVMIGSRLIIPLIPFSNLYKHTPLICY